MIITLASFKGGVGKTTSAIHLGCYFAELGTTLLVDGDPNRSATGWANRGELPFKVVDLFQAPMQSRNFEHVIIDTAARPSQEDLKALVDGCDLLVLPTSPDALAMDALIQTIDTLQALGSDRFRILLTLIPPKPRKTGAQAREALEGLPVFQKGIRRLVCFETAALQGIPVFKVKDRNAGIAWRDYQAIGQEILS